MPKPRVLGILVSAAFVTTVAVTVFLTFGHRYDFTAFYTDGAAWNDKAPLYTRANLNPPSATVAVFAPLAQLPFIQAQIIWTLAGLAALLAAVRVVALELEWTSTRAVTATALLLVTHSAYLVFAFGQVTWLLLWPATMAWVAYRRNRPYVAGAWFGVLVAVKPTLVIAVLVLSWPVWLTAAAVSMSASALAISVTGWPVWLQWFETGRAISWIEDPLNASVWGFLARVEAVARLRDLSLASVVLALAVCGWAVWRTLFVTQPDRRLACAWLLHVTISPLGWIYYLPLAFGPVSASWPNGAASWIAFALLCAPLGLIQPLPFNVVLGVTYPLALAFAWTAWGRRQRFDAARVPA